MSRQINYYMGKKEETQFIQFVLGNNLIFINRNDGTKVNPLEDKGLFYCITKEAYLSLLTFRNNAVDILHSLVIEYSKNNVIEDKSIVTRGRIYISDACRESKYLAYADDFVKDYSLLSNWIKKNIPFQEYVNLGKIQKTYISDSMLAFSDRNYRFQA